MIKCPRHGAEFDVTSGKVVGQVKIPLIGKAKELKTWPVIVEGDDLFLDL
jgi:nitrite reductase/ring-hydroxylating ferredoxin subunit